MFKFYKIHDKQPLTPHIPLSQKPVKQEHNNY